VEYEIALNILNKFSQIMEKTLLKNVDHGEICS